MFRNLGYVLNLCLLLFAACVASPTHAAMNDPCGCNAGLAPEVTKYDSSSQIELAFIQQIDDKQYEEIKKSGKASANILELVTGSASYSEFQNKRREYFSNTNFSLNSEQSQSLLFTTVRTSDWGACKRQCIRSQQGFVCDVADFTARVVAVSCSWRPEGTVAPKRVSVTANNQPLTPQTIDPGTTKDWQFTRDPAVDLLMTFTPKGGSSQTIKVVATPVVLPSVVRPVKLGSCIGRGGLEGVHLWGPEGEDCNGIATWGKYLVNSASPAPSRICSCIGHGGPEGVRLWGPEGETCAGIKPWGTYNEQCVPATSLTVCGCVGHGNILEGHRLWGPKGKACGGMADPRWGEYSQSCVGPR